MHQIKMACIVRHCEGQRGARAASCAASRPSSCCWPPRRPRARRGGNVRSSEAADRARRRGRSRSSARRPSSPTRVEADGIVTTARRAADAAGLRPGAGGAAEERLHARAAAGLGHARHARHPQRGLHACARARPPTRSCRSRTRRSMRRPWCRTRICCGARSGPASPRRATAKAQAFIRNALRAVERPDAARAPRISPRPLSSLRTLRSVLATRRCAAIERA